MFSLYNTLKNIPSVLSPLWRGELSDSRCGCRRQVAQGVCHGTVGSLRTDDPANPWMDRRIQGPGARGQERKQKARQWVKHWYSYRNWGPSWAYPWCHGRAQECGPRPKTWSCGRGCALSQSQGQGETQLEAPTLVRCDKALERSPGKAEIGFDMRRALKEARP